MAEHTKDFDRITLNWRNTATEAPAMARRALTMAAILLVGYVKTKKLSGSPIHRRTGNLSSHVDFEVAEGDGGIVARVGVIRGVPYAKGLEEGNPPHIIKPNLGAVDFSTDHYSQRARALKFVNKAGATVFARVVHHPGNPPFRFLRSSLQENREKIKDIFRRELGGEAVVE